MNASREAAGNELSKTKIEFMRVMFLLVLLFPWIVRAGEGKSPVAGSSFSVRDLSVADPSVTGLPVSGLSVTETKPPVTGKVQNEKGEALPGASVIAKNETTGRTKGINSETDGTFHFDKLSEGPYSFTISSVGYTAQTLKGFTVKKGEQVVLLVVLKPASGALDQVVVVGYGSQLRGKTTGAIAQLKSDKYADQPIYDLGQGMAGQLSGIQVAQTSGAPGSSVTVRVRGLNSITAGNQPLYVVDGFPMTDANTSLINPSDIETIDVLKDAAAAAIYGSRGSNGVVLITTRKGSLTKPKMEFDTYYGVQSVAKKIPMMDAYQYANFVQQSRNNSWLAASPTHSISDPNSVRPIVDQIPDFLQPYLQGQKGLTNTNWEDALFRKTPMQSYSLSYSGGKGGTKYYVSGDYFDQQGIIIHSDFKKYAVRFNLENKVSDKVSFGINLAPSYAKSNKVSEGQHSNDGVVITSLIAMPNFPIYNPDGSFALGNQEKQAVKYSMAALENPIAVASLIKDELDRFRIQGGAYLDVQLAKGLKFRTYAGTDYSASTENYFRPSVLGAYRTPPPSVATGSVSTDNTINWLTENTLTWHANFAAKHDLTVLAGYTTQKETANDAYIEGQGYPNDQVQPISAATIIVKAGNPGTTLPGTSSTVNEWSLVSWLGRVNYDYLGKYLLSASLRRDGSSRFGPDNRWGWFPSAAIGWLISKESFFPQATAISDLKLRASYGTTGNFQIPNYGSYSTLTGANYVLGNAFVNGQSPSTAPNPALSWEKTGQVNIGLDASFFQGKLSATADYYVSKTNDLLLNVPLPYASGYKTILENIGSVRNQGIELSVSSQLNIGKVVWTGTFNISTDDNKVTALGPGQSQIINDRNVTQVGHPIGTFFGYNILGVFKDQQDLSSYPHLSTAIPGNYKYQDVNKDGKITTDDRTILGSPFPHYIAGFSSNFRYRNFDLGFLLQTVQGNKIANISRVTYYINGEGWGNATEYEYKGHYNSPSSPGTGYAINLSQPTDNNHQYSSYMIEDGSFIRLRNISLGYSLPAGITKRLAIEKARVYVSAQNLFTITHYSGFNPETSQNGSSAAQPAIEDGTYPVAKTVVVGLNIGF